MIPESERKTKRAVSSSLSWVLVFHRNRGSPSRPNNSRQPIALSFQWIFYVTHHSNGPSVLSRSSNSPRKESRRVCKGGRFGGRVSVGNYSNWANPPLKRVFSVHGSLSLLFSELPFPRKKSSQILSGSSGKHPRTGFSRTEEVGILRLWSTFFPRSKVIAPNFTLSQAFKNYCYKLTANSMCLLSR